MNKKLEWTCLYAVAFLSLFNVALLGASELNPREILKKHYLSKFIENSKDTDAMQLVDEEEDTIRPYPLIERMTPLKTRTILLHFLCPECSGKTHLRNNFPINYHSDVWLDTQVFQVAGKKHIYDAAFPGATLLGEVYGAYMLVKGGTQDLKLLKLRQKLIRQIQLRGVAGEFRERLTSVEQWLARGTAIFDRKHPFNMVSKGGIFSDEKDVGDFMGSGVPGSLLEHYTGVSKQERTVQANEQALANNLRGEYAWQMVQAPYLLGLITVAVAFVDYKFTGRARALTLLPWQGFGNCIVNSLKSLTMLGGFAPYVVLPAALFHSAREMYMSHWNLKNVKEVLTQELLDIEPFLDALFSFRDIVNLPLVDFHLTESERVTIDMMLKRIKNLDRGESHFFQRSLPEVAGALRQLLLLRESIIRYLINIARLDFYISVAEVTQDTRLWSFAEFIDDEQVKLKPWLAARKLWNPALSPDKAVPSDVAFGGKRPASIVLTGANASGKSTFIRGVGINTIFMAQTLGVAAAERFKIRPFSHFHSLMEKRDRHGRSSYETEVDAVVRVWDINSKLSTGHRSLILADELFRTTNPKEGSGASEVMSKKLGYLPHVSLLVSTHFSNMRQLAVEHPERFANKHMSVETDDQTGEIISMHYQLMDGPSPSTNAISLFKQKFTEQFSDL